MSHTNAIPMTVIIRSYNDAKLLPRTLAALDQQRGVDCRYIVFESASVDDSLAILQAWGKAEIIEMEPQLSFFGGFECRCSHGTH